MSNKCPFCGSENVTTYKRGFSWLLGCLGFFIAPLIGLLIGFVGKDKLMHKCEYCGKKWSD